MPPTWLAIWRERLNERRREYGQEGVGTYVDVGGTADVPAGNGCDHLNNSVFISLLETAVESFIGGSFAFITRVNSGGVAMPDYQKSAS